MHKISIKKRVQIPIIGTLTAWQANTKNKKNSKMYFALRVRSNAMSKSGIFNGDLVIVKNI